MGKGLEWYILIELLIYASANWVPMALPLSVIMASIMTFGNLGENNELTAMKASGLSLFKIMKPLMVLIVFISCFAFYFTNSLWPIANFKMRVLLGDIQNTKIALALQPGVFFKSDDFSIRVAEKNDDGISFKDILIYDRTQMKRQTLGAWSYNKDPRDFKRIIRAKQGKIISSGNKTALNLELEDGYIIQEWNPKSIGDSKMPFTRYYFESASLNFNLQSFNFQRSEEDTYQREQYLLNLNQIALLKDSSLKEQRDRNASLNSYI
jgi:lipopolysaccharide export system permease protein